MAGRCRRTNCWPNAFPRSKAYAPWQRWSVNRAVRKFGAPFRSTISNRQPALRSSLIAVAVTAERAAAPVLLSSRPSGLHGIEGLGRTRVHPRAAEIARVRPEPRFAVRIIEAIIAAGVEALRRAA